MDLKQGLAGLQAHLAELEASARKLPNQNFADLIKAAGGRLAQASEHPDLEAVGEQLRADLHGNQEQEELKFSPGPQGGPALDFDPATGAGTTSYTPPFVPPQSDGA